MTTVDLAQARKAHRTGLSGHELAQKIGVSHGDAIVLADVGRKLSRIDRYALSASEILVMQIIASITREGLLAGSPNASIPGCFGASGQGIELVRVHRRQADMSSTTAAAASRSGASASSGFSKRQCLAQPCGLGADPRQGGGPMIGEVDEIDGVHPRAADPRRRLPGCIAALCPWQRQLGGDRRRCSPPCGFWTQRAALRGAVHALRSYQHDNASPDLAKVIADVGELALKGEKP